MANVYKIAIGDNTYNISTANAVTFNNGGSGAASGSTFDGSSALTVSYNTIGAAASSHSHSYLPLSGGTMTGTIILGDTSASRLLLRTNDSYKSGIGYDTQGNECIALWAKNAVTRLRWNAGTDMSSMTTGTMMGITPDFEVSKASGTPTGYIGGCIIIHTGNIGSQSVSYATSAGSASSATYATSAGSAPASDVYSWAKASSKPSYTYSEVGAAASSHTHTKSQITDFPSSMPASDVYSWAKASSKPSYTYSEVGAAASSHSHSSVTYATYTGNATVTSDTLKNIYAGTSDMTAGSSSLTTGTIYLVYE